MSGRMIHQAGSWGAPTVTTTPVCAKPGEPHSVVPSQGMVSPDPRPPATPPAKSPKVAAAITRKPRVPPAPRTFNKVLQHAHPGRLCKRVLLLQPPTNVRGVTQPSHTAPQVAHERADSALTRCLVDCTVPRAERRHRSVCSAHGALPVSPLSSAITVVLAAEAKRRCQ